MLKGSWLKFKKNWLSYPIAYLSKFTIRLLLRTCQIEVEGLNQFVEVASRKRCILMLWHNRLGIVSEILYKFAPQFIYSAFISKSHDGEPLAILAKSYQAGRAIRVPHNARHQALKMVIDNLKSDRDVIIFTPDGPKGPKYEAKAGIALAATEVDAMIIPFSWQANDYWELSTWDRFRLPKPFSHIKVTWGNPLSFDNGEINNRDVVKKRLKEALVDIETPASGIADV
jgi:lysophospholipid acyltransferase (LPLAT)-like uncharacterized protein